MNLNFSSISKLFNPKSGENITKRGELKPDRDWRIVFIAMVGVIVLSAVYHSYLFWNILKQETVEVDGGVGKSLPSVPLDTLKKLDELFDLKEDRLNKIREQRPSYVDPSI